MTSLIRVKLKGNTKHLNRKVSIKGNILIKTGNIVLQPQNKIHGSNSYCPMYEVGTVKFFKSTTVQQQNHTKHNLIIFAGFVMSRAGHTCRDSC